MNSALLVVLAQMFLTSCALLMGHLIEMPWLGMAGALLLAASAAAAHLFQTSKEKIWRFALLAAWGGTLLIPASFLLTTSQKVWDDYYAIPAWLMAAVILLAAQRISDGAKQTKWRKLGLTWCFLGSAVWLVGAYMQNRPMEFCIGLFSSLLWLVLCRIWFRPGALGIQVVNTLILFFIVFPTLDLAMRLHSLSEINSASENYYSYEAAQKHPAGYALWTRYYEEQWVAAMHDLYEIVPDRDPNFRLKPDSHGHFFKSQISINHLGFRGKDFPVEKGNAYRIVALGESTTFGATLKVDDRPWPELLEQMIRDRLKLRRPVQVINAGTPSYNLETNLRRLPGEILPLKPDMIISYHGYNGFKFIDGALPPPLAKPPPRYNERPLKLLGDVEYGIKLTIYKKRLAFKTGRARPPLAPPMQTRYARDYAELNDIARTNGIRLVLANYSMAVNTNSDRAITEFYRRAFPQVYEQIRANEVHTALVREFGQAHPEVCLVDTHPHLDGDHDKFIDLIHLTQSGRQQLAENIFAAIKPVLEKDLSSGE